MSPEVLAFLVQDGITTGTIYVLLALALVLIFLVTRVLFVPQGEIVTYAALTLTTLERGLVPPTMWFAVTLALACAAQDLYHSRAPMMSARQGVGVLAKLAAPIGAVAISYLIDLRQASQLVLIGLTLLTVIPLGPFLYQLVFEPVEKASILVLLIIAMALHLVLSGLGLIFFGPEGWRAKPVASESFIFGPAVIPGQALIIVAVSIGAIALLWIFGRTFLGKALRATAINPRGAQIVGINPSFSGRLAFLLASALGAISGVLIAAITTIYYDTGFLIGLKGFTGAVLGGLVGYLPAAVGALAIGLSESAAAFFASEYKEVIVFSLILPVLLFQSIVASDIEDEEEEE